MVCVAAFLGSELSILGNMKTVFLHIGMHKTGTSAIQSFLSGNEAVLSRAGVLYPKSLRSTINHDLLAWSAVRRYGESRYPSLPLAKVIAELLSELECSSASTVVLSSEFFWPATIEEIQKLREAFSAFGVSVVIYVRNFKEFLVSGYAQGVKSGAFDRINRAYLEQTLWRYDLDPIVGDWKAVLGEDRVSVRVYNKVRSSLLSDFLTQCGIPMDGCELGDARVNTTPLPSMIRALRGLNQVESIFCLPQACFGRLKRRWGMNKASRIENLVVSSLFGGHSLVTDEMVQLFRELTFDMRQRFLTNHVEPDDHYFFDF